MLAQGATAPLLRIKQGVPQGQPLPGWVGPALESTPFKRLSGEMMCILLQEYFPPVGDTISKKYDKYAGKHYEWASKNGWRVTCYLNGGFVIRWLRDRGGL